MLAVQATNLDRPALCGVDVLLRMELGTDYARANHGTWYAAYAVAELMREMGYVEAGTARAVSGLAELGFPRAAKGRILGKRFGFVRVPWRDPIRRTCASAW